MTDWDDAYANAAHIPGSDRWPGAWADAASTYRGAMAAAGQLELDIPYGAHPRQRLDLFRPTSPPSGLVVFVHGGYWLALDKSFWSHLARGAVERGFAVAIPSYRLCPEVRIGDIARDIAVAVTCAADIIAGPVLLAGHSAGGQLVARLATTTTPLAPGICDRLRGVTTISGLHDLRPLMATLMNATLGIDAVEAARESPALLSPLLGVGVSAWVGGEERPEFIRQSRLLASAWPDTELPVDAGRHHFDVLDSMTDPASSLTRTIIGD